LQGEAQRLERRDRVIPWKEEKGGSLPEKRRFARRETHRGKKRRKMRRGVFRKKSSEHFEGRKACGRSTKEKLL